MRPISCLPVLDNGNSRDYLERMTTLATKLLTKNDDRFFDCTDLEGRLSGGTFTCDFPLKLEFEHGVRGCYRVKLTIVGQDATIVLGEPVMF